MNRFITLWILLAMFMPGIVDAKRSAPPKVEPVIFEGVRYTCPNNDGKRAYVQAFDATTGKRLWEASVFRNRLEPGLEADVQHVYIKTMSVADGKLRVTAEDGRAYAVDLKTHVVEKITKGQN